MKKVTIEFLYGNVKGKDDQYYKDLAFNEIIDGNNFFDSRDFEIEDIGD